MILKNVPHARIYLHLLAISIKSWERKAKLALFKLQRELDSTRAKKYSVGKSQYVHL
jgi:hypothetical protein